MVESSRKKVVITGITGFLGSHVCDYFLKDGSFDVRGTVRDKNNETKLAPLRKAFGENFNKLELVEADLLKPETIDEAIKGCDYVIHTASPFPIEQPKDENVLIKPAVEGTLAAVQAAHKYKVKRIVITSSVAAIAGQKPENYKEVYNENDWTDVSAVGAYMKSKTLAEKAAWDYLNGLPESEKFELVIINPVLILGPSLITGDFSSGQIITKLLSGKLPGMPKIMMSIVDVRDVAYAHLQAIKIEDAKNKRFILSSDSVWFKDVAEVLRQAYPRQNVKTGEICYCLVKVASWFDNTAKMILPMWNRVSRVDHTQSEKVLGIKYISTTEAITTMAESLFEAGMIQRK